MMTKSSMGGAALPRASPRVAAPPMAVTGLGSRYGLARPGSWSTDEFFDDPSFWCGCSEVQLQADRFPGKAKASTDPSLMRGISDADGGIQDGTGPFDTKGLAQGCRHGLALSHGVLAALNGPQNQNSDKDLEPHEGGSADKPDPRAQARHAVLRPAQRAGPGRCGSARKPWLRGKAKPLS